MTADPERLAEAGDLGASLLRAGRAERAPAHLHGKTAAAIGVATTLVAGKAAASVPLLGKLGALAQAATATAAGKLAVVTAVLAIAVPAAIVARRAQERVVAPAPVVIAPAPRAPPGSAPSASAAPAPIAPPAPKPAPLASLAVPSAVSPPSSAPSAASPIASAAPDPLVAELALLDAARRALARSDAGEALRLLKEREARFPRGAMADEALVLRVEALVQAGRVTEAKALADAYLEQNPGSAYAPRLRALVDR